MSWLRGGRAKTAPETPKDPSRRLAAALTRLPLDHNLPAEVVRYVVTGEPASVLTKLASGDHRIPQALSLGFVAPADVEGAQLWLLTRLDRIAADQALRWARVLDVARRLQWGEPTLELIGEESWFEALLLHAACLTGATARHELNADPAVLPMALLRFLVHESGADDAALINGVFGPTRDATQAERARAVVAQSAGYGDWVIRNARGVVATMLATDADDQAQVLSILIAALTDDQLRLLAPVLAELVTGNLGKVRDAALPLVERVFGAATARLRHIAVEGSAARRLLALQLLLDHGSAEDREWVASVARSDKSVTVRSLVASTPPAPDEALDEPNVIDLPTVRAAQTATTAAQPVESDESVASVGSVESVDRADADAVAPSPHQANTAPAITPQSAPATVIPEPAPATVIPESAASTSPGEGAPPTDLTPQAPAPPAPAPPAPATQAPATQAPAPQASPAESSADAPPTDAPTSAPAARSAAGPSPSPVVLRSPEPPASTTPASERSRTQRTGAMPQRPNSAPTTWRVRPSYALDDLMVSLVGGITDEVRRQRDHHERLVNERLYLAETAPTWSPPTALPSRRLLRDLRRAIYDPDPLALKAASGRLIPGSQWLPEVLIKEHLGQPNVTPILALKLLAWSGQLVQPHDSTEITIPAVGVLHALPADQRWSLSQIADLMDQLGLDGPSAVLLAATRSEGRLGVDWPTSYVSPFFAAHLDRALEQHLTKLESWQYDPKAFYEGIAGLDRLPSSLVDALFDLAITAKVADRELAQNALRRERDLVPRLAELLADRRADVRIAAAQWLGQLGDPQAEAALELALPKERTESVRGELLEALEAVGAPVGQLVTPEGLSLDARANSSRALTKGLEWLTKDQLPIVRWATSGRPVDPEVLLHLADQATRAKSPEPGIALRQTGALFEHESRAAFADFLLRGWLGSAAPPDPAAESVLTSQAQAAELYDDMQRRPEAYADDPRLGMSLPELTTTLMGTSKRRVRSPGLATKGLLAVVAATGGPRCVATAGAVLSTPDQLGLAQAKAVLSMLSWVEHSSALDLLVHLSRLSTVSAYREEAAVLIEAVGKRRRWSAEELADRTIPKLGFDITGRLSLPFGSRAFTATLTPDYDLILTHPRGHQVDALPRTGKNDDPALARTSRRVLSEVRVEVQWVRRRESERLLTAFHDRRSWSAREWERLLLLHPLVRPLVSGLVWVVHAPHLRDPISFRAFSALRLIDLEGDVFRLPSDGTVRLAHADEFAPYIVDRWCEHFAETGETPLFDQFVAPPLPGQLVFPEPPTPVLEDPEDDVPSPAPKAAQRADVQPPTSSVVSAPAIATTSEVRPSQSRKRRGFRASRAWQLLTNPMQLSADPTPAALPVAPAAPVPTRPAVSEPTATQSQAPANTPVPPQQPPVQIPVPKKPTPATEAAPAKAPAAPETPPQAGPIAQPTPPMAPPSDSAAPSFEALLAAQLPSEPRTAAAEPSMADEGNAALELLSFEENGATRD